jgi:hypothetical protein
MFVLPMLESLALHKITDPRNTIIPLLLISSKSLRSFTSGSSTPMVSVRWHRHMEHLTTLELGSPAWRHGAELIRALNRIYEPQFLPRLQEFVHIEWDSENICTNLLLTLEFRCM